MAETEEDVLQATLTDFCFGGARFQSQSRHRLSRMRFSVFVPIYTEHFSNRQQQFPTNSLLLHHYYKVLPFKPMPS
jgi:hypothetical protein